MLLSEEAEAVPEHEEVPVQIFSELLALCQLLFLKLFFVLESDLLVDLLLKLCIK